MQPKISPADQQTFVQLPISVFTPNIPQFSILNSQFNTARFNLRMENKYYPSIKHKQHFTAAKSISGHCVPHSNKSYTYSS